MKKIAIASTLLSVLFCFGGARILNAEENTGSNQITISGSDISKGAFGWATCISFDENGYEMKGGEGETAIILKSNGRAMDKEISEAIQNYGIIVFDGSAGTFTVERTIFLKELRNKTIYGINGAELHTAFKTTSAIMAALDSVGVKKMKNEKGSYILSNGKRVSELLEYTTRQTIINLTGDKKENYRECGIFYIEKCENLIFRNLSFVGPGSIDTGGRDLIRIVDSTSHIWIDHCNFLDGMKGHINISQGSDFCTISNCCFEHSELAYTHAFSVLIGGSYRPEDAGLLNVTLAGNYWGHGCKMRVPMARSGMIHVFNCYYDSPGANGGVNAREASNFLVENCYWSKDTPRCFSASKANGYTLRGNYSEKGLKFPEDLGEEERVAYEYKLLDVMKVPESVLKNAGAKLIIK